MKARGYFGGDGRYTVPGLIAGVFMLGVGVSIIHDPAAAGRYLLAGWLLSLAGFWKVAVVILNE